MPTYTYRCPCCQAVQSVVASMMDAQPAPACAACGGLTERYMGVAPAVLGGASPKTDLQPETSAHSETTIGGCHWQCTHAHHHHPHHDAELGARD